MKRILTALIVSAIAVGAAAQEGSTGLGIQFGFAQTDFRVNSWDPKVDGKELNTTALNGFKAGLVWDATYAKGFGSMIGINYTFGTYSSGWKKLYEWEYPKYKDQGFYHQMELFVDWQYKFQIAGDTYVILYTGPTLQCQLSLKETTFERSINQVDKTTKEIQRYDYDDDQLHTDYKRINVTWGVGVGFQYDRYYIRGGYDFGLINPYKINNFNEVESLVKQYGTDYSRATRGRIDQWSIKIGVFFWQKD